MLGAIQIGMAGLLWVSALLCLPSAIRGRRRLLFWFLVFFAAAMTLQPAPIYDVVDAALGGVNITYFVFHAFAIIAVALVDSLVQDATVEGGITRARQRATVTVGLAIIGVQAALFFGSDWRLTDDIQHMFISRWDYTLYASTTWFALAYFSVSVAIACLADLPRQRRRVTRLSLVFIVLGCLGVLVFAVVSILNSTLLSLDQGSGFTSATRGIYFTVLIAAPISLAVGLGLTTAVEGVTTAHRSIRDRTLLLQITPLWERLIAGSPEFSLEAPTPRVSLAFAREPGARLYRRYVEVRDSLLLHPQNATARERALLEAVERHTHAVRAGTATGAPEEINSAPPTTHLRG
jgi:hypothetical protein